MPPSNAPSWAINSLATITNADGNSDTDSHVSLSTSPDGINLSNSTITNEEDGHHDEDAHFSNDNDSDAEFENWIQEAASVH